MTETRPHPDLWYPIARLLAALRTLLRATPPEAFSEIALHARAHLAALAALVRRYIHVLAAELELPPSRCSVPSADHLAEQKAAARSRRDYLFPLIETPAPAGPASSGDDPPGLQWALLMEAVQRLVAVMADPARHARRLARRFGTRLTEGLRETPVRWHVLRRAGPCIDNLLLKADQAARPLAWAGLDTS